MHAIEDGKTIVNAMGGCVIFICRKQEAGKHATYSM